MKKATSLIALGLLVVTGLSADTDYKYINAWNTDIYFGHVIYPEAKHDGKDAVVLREGRRTLEVADLNLPLAPGDTIRTSERRCEIQFDTGTVIRIDRNSELKIETILAQSLSSNNQLTNLLLLKGLVEEFEKQAKKSPLAKSIIEAFYEQLDSVILRMNKIQQVYGVDVDLSFLKELDGRE